MYDIAILGGGTMGQLLAERWLVKGLVAPEQLVVCEKETQRRSALEKLLWCKVCSPEEDFTSRILILSVKPQDAAEAVALLRQRSRPEIALSIMTGVPLARIQESLGNKVAVARLMPNLPIRVDRGLTAFFAPENSAVTRPEIERLFGCCGINIEVQNEELIDAATALSASGPGFVYYFLEVAMEVAEEMGFSPAQASELALETCHGAVALCSALGKSPIELRRQVTSKAGTTAAAVEVFEREKVAEGFKNGLRRALDRAKEFRNLFDRGPAK